MTDLSSFTPSYLKLTTHQPPQGGPSLLEELKNVREARERHRRPHDVKYLGSLSDDLEFQGGKPGQEFYGLKDTVKMLGHENVGAIDVFKIDCEGCEWTTFDAWLQPDMPDLKQILIEIHKPPADIATYFFDTLQASGYARFHKEVNIICPEAGATEYSFIKLSKDFFPESKLVVKNDKYK
jgi:hypothetical protein